MTLLHNWDNNSLPLTTSGTNYSDLWGYAAGGREYAILGGSDGHYIFDVTIPTATSLVTFLPGSSPNSVWRDYQTYQNYLYAVSDQGATSSLQIYNLSNLPTSVTKVYDSQALFSRAHNIVVDAEAGRLYVCGASVQPAGILILDIATNPANPTLLADFTLGAYTHDVAVIRDTLYAFFGTSNGLASFDFVDLMNPSLIGMLFAYPEQGFAHGGCMTPDMRYLYFIDETHNTGVHICDISEPANPIHVSTFRSALQGPTFTNSIGHMAFVHNNYLYTSYYHDGVQIWDITNPLAPIKAAHFDTYPINTDYTGMRGAWGVYPYLPSGNILVSDTQNGLFVLRQDNLIFPVTLTEFDAKLVDSKVELVWHTETERNNATFTVERSQDGTAFEAIHQLPGAGNSHTSRRYEALDSQPLEGLSYYRIKQTDYDGKCTYSEIKSVNRGTGLNLMAVFPSPAVQGEPVSTKVQTEAAGYVRVVVSDAMGRTVHAQDVELPAGLHTLQLPTDTWAAGSYTVKLAGKGKVTSDKFVIGGQ